VNGRVVTELGTKADAGADRIEAAGRVITAEERRVHILLNKPPEIVATMADPEGRKTLRNLLRGLPERVYPVGRLDYAASGLIFLTNDGDLAAEMLKHWKNLPQVYHVKVKGRLTMEQLDQFGKEAEARMAAGCRARTRRELLVRSRAERFQARRAAPGSVRCATPG
jgi:23S rRNA pseudouridine2605 synthase